MVWILIVYAAASEILHLVGRMKLLSYCLCLLREKCGSLSLGNYLCVNSNGVVGTTADTRVAMETLKTFKLYNVVAEAASSMWASVSG